jgi:DNA-binding NtrC family response regulator
MDRDDLTPFPMHPLPSTFRAPSEPGDRQTHGEGFYKTKRAAIAAFEREYFTGLARACTGNVSEMARQSGMKRHHVRAYLRRHGIDRHELGELGERGRHRAT